MPLSGEYIPQGGGRRCQLQELVEAGCRVVAPQGQLSDSFMDLWHCIMRNGGCWPAEVGRPVPTEDGHL